MKQMRPVSGDYGLASAEEAYIADGVKTKSKHGPVWVTQKTCRRICAGSSGNGDPCVGMGAQSAGSC